MAMTIKCSHEVSLENGLLWIKVQYSIGYSKGKGDKVPY